MNATAKNIVRATPVEGVILLTIKSTDDRIKFMGASCPASPLPMTGNLTSFTLAPHRGKKGVVAIKVSCQSSGKREPESALYYLLKISYYAAEPSIDLDDHFVAGAGCLAQLTNDGLFVTAGDQKFVAPDFDYSLVGMEEQSARKQALWAKQGIRIVPDANLLCHFLVGEAPLEQVEAAAEALKEEDAWPEQRKALEKRFEERCQQIREQAAQDAQVLANDKTAAEEVRQNQQVAASNSSKKAFAQILALQLSIDQIAEWTSISLGKRAMALKKIGRICQTVISCRERIGQ